MAMGSVSTVLRRRPRARRSRWRASGAAGAVALLGLTAGLAAVSLARPSPGDVAANGRSEGEFGSPSTVLRQAVAALERGDSLRAEALLVMVAERYPIVADYADLMRLRLLVASKRHDDAVTMGVRWSGRDSPLRPDLFDTLARAHAALGNHETARAAWATAIADTGDPERLASFHVRVGASLALSGEFESAADSYLKVWTSYPLSEEAPGVEAQLDALEARVARPLRTGDRWRHRGDALYRLRRNEQALVAYDRALASGDLSPAERRRAERQRAQTLFRLRRYTEAAKAFAVLPTDDETAIWQARSLARSGHPKNAARMLERIGRDSRTKEAPRAYFLAALLWDGEGETARARTLFAKVAKQRKRRSYAVASLWRLGWADYRAGRFESAIGYFERLQAQESDPIAGLRARYWGARAAMAAGRISAEFAAIAREFPLSYYGWRSRARVGAADVDLAAADPAAGTRVDIGAGSSNLSPSDIERPRILLQAGLEVAALEELDRLFVRARGRDDRLALAQLYADAGDFNRPQRLMVDAYAESLARGPAPHQLELWWHAWPVAFSADVDAATKGGSDPDTALVYAVMREESGYRPDVVSSSGARGLLQLMPETAERVARGAGMSKPSADDLFLPHLNIRLGSLYLSELLRRFEGRRSAAIGGYNAGPRTVGRWLEAAAGEDDEWVEDISYDQTRAYVKRVMRSIHAYRVLY
jgi:soluble lytic murein transglycosylase